MEGEGDYLSNKMYLQAKISISLFILIHFPCFIGPFNVPADLQILDCTFSTVSTCRSNDFQGRATVNKFSEPMTERGEWRVAFQTGD